MRNSTLSSPTTAAGTTIDAVSIRTAEVVRILRAAGGSLLVQAALHVELLRIEWAEEKSRLLKLAVATLLGFVCLLGLLVALGALLLALYWDTPYRVRAVGTLLAAYGLGLALAWRLFRSQAARGSHSFAATRSELAADLELLRSQL
jgi:uncharacterized membrane protein YqjE